MRRRLLATAVVAAVALVGGAVPAQAAPASASASALRLANTAHLDFLLQSVRLPSVAGHATTGSDPVELPWTYADRQDDGSFRRVGGGTWDAATDTYGQGAFNSDDVARTAVVYVRDWTQTGDAAARAKARAVLRGLAYFQTTTGAHAGDVVLWMQPDGTLNRSATPKELPDPSDSGPSFWLARTIWAYGEGWAAFRRSDPAFAGFLRDRLRLAVRALDREVLDRYGETEVADGVRVPAWLITGGADATSEAVLGLAAYTAAAPTDRGPRRALSRLADGIARLAATTSDADRWPYGAILPSTASRSSWHAWASQTSAALVAASGALRDRRLLAPAVRDSGRFGPALLALGGPVDLLGPAPVDRTEIAYGIDSRVEDLLATGTATRAPGLQLLAGLQAGWFFGANAAGTPVYDPATGVTADGVQADGTVNRNSGAESTIHGLLTMLALDAHPALARVARSLTATPALDGLRVVEAESAATDGTVFTPDPASTAESTWSGKGLALTAGETARFDLGTGDHLVEAVVDEVERGTATAPVSRWTGGGADRTLRAVVGAQGITPEPGALLPQAVGEVRGATVTARGVAGTVRIDALLVRPTVESVRWSGGTTLLAAADDHRRTAVVRAGAHVERFDASGRSAGAATAPRSGRVTIPAGGFAIAHP